MNDLDIQRLRDLARSNDFLPLDRQLLRDAANAIERTLNPVPLQSRSEFRAVFEDEDGYRTTGPIAGTRADAKHQFWNTRSRDVVGMEYRTVVESDWRPTHV